MSRLTFLRLRIELVESCSLLSLTETTETSGPVGVANL